MLLQALTAYYEELLRQGKISAPGWENKFKVSFQLLLDEQGDLLRVDDLRLPVKKGKKDVLSPQEYPVPAHVKRSSGVAANFLCDNCTYLLGADEKGKPDRAMECFKACAALHHTILDGVDSPAAKALLAYFDRWQPEQAAVHPLVAPYWKDLNNNANHSFCVEWYHGTSLHVNASPTQRSIPPSRAFRGRRPPALRWSPSTHPPFAPTATSRVKTHRSANTRPLLTPRP